MAGKKVNNPKATAQFYRDNPESYAKKKAYETKRGKSEEQRKYRTILQLERVKRGIAGKGGKDLSHTQDGRLVPESPSKNRARNGANGKSTKK